MDYRQLEGVNQSSLKKILISPKEFLKAVEKQQNNNDSIEPHFLFGSVVDIMLTGTRDEFDEKYIRIPDETKCSETVKKIIDDIFNVVKAVAESEDIEILPLENYSTIILRKARENNFQNNYKDDTLINTVIKQGEAYFELLKTTVGKTPITESEYAKAVNAVMALKSDKYTKPYVVKKERKNAEFWDKFIVQFEYNGVPIKGELDRVIVDHDTKEIIPIDFKTTGKTVNSFISDFWYYRYDFQAATYALGLRQNEIVADLVENKGYQIKDFLYIVVETNLVNNPMVFKVPHTVYNIGFSGGIVKNKEYEGFGHAIKRYIFASTNDAWEYPMEYYQNNGIMEIDV
jgi:hypothetical protein